jgi:hypothetical protein
MAKCPDLGISPTSYLAGETMTSKQYHFVELQSDGYVHLCDSGSATYFPIGILQNAPASGEEAAVCMLGCSLLKVDSTGASYGAWITTNGSAYGSATTTASLACAIALADSNTSASSIIPVFFSPAMGWLTRKA